MVYFFFPAVLNAPDLYRRSHLRFRPELSSDSTEMDFALTVMDNVLTGRRPMVSSLFRIILSASAFP